ncbi:hypothetical protein [Brucella pseudogrignonensis]|uniref:Uncharacterized protein n=1 Tax=Brucella pseudogrignonensis TaxID=419475 RepID=A0ABU1MAP4_9HYPH|nr:hypothetical protein [Brucella pseudogrignonensis]MDR6433084.1 hypothetical protein [Brucella pseudogrignonensis]
MLSHVASSIGLGWRERLDRAFSALIRLGSFERMIIRPKMRP